MQSLFDLVTFPEAKYHILFRPVVLYHVVFSRAWEPYGRRYIALQITLNVVAFCCFWLPPRAGGREGLAITSMLASVTAELVISAKLPASSEVSECKLARFVLYLLMTN